MCQILEQNLWSFVSIFQSHPRVSDRLAQKINFQRYWKNLAVSEGHELSGRREEMTISRQEAVNQGGWYIIEDTYDSSGHSEGINIRHFAMCEQKL